MTKTLKELWDEMKEITKDVEIFIWTTQDQRPFKPIPPCYATFAREKPESSDMIISIRKERL